MTTTDITSDRRRSPVSVLLAHAWAAACTIPMTLMAAVMALPGVMARYRERCRDDELGAISVEQFAWIGIALFLIVAAAAALKSIGATSPLLLRPRGAALPDKEGANAFRPGTRCRCAREHLGHRHRGLFHPDLLIGCRHQLGR